MKGQFWRGHLTYVEYLKDDMCYGVITTQAHSSPEDALQELLKKKEDKALADWRILKLQVFSHPNKIWKIQELRERTTKVEVTQK